MIATASSTGVSHKRAARAVVKAARRRADGLQKTPGADSRTRKMSEATPGTRGVGEQLPRERPEDSPRRSEGYSGDMPWEHERQVVEDAEAAGAIGDEFAPTTHAPRYGDLQQSSGWATGPLAPGSATVAANVAASHATAISVAVTRGFR